MVAEVMDGEGLEVLWKRRLPRRILSGANLVMVKPDGVEGGLVGQIINRIEARGFRLMAIKMLRISEDLARKHYAEHVEKKFFPEMLSFITSGPVVAMVWEGPEVINSIRQLMGATDPAQAAPGTIRETWGSISKTWSMAPIRS